MTKEVHLGLFIFPGGHHVAGWRHPSVAAKDITAFSYYKIAAQLAERGKFDLFFVGDALAAHERNGRPNGEAPLSNIDSVAICSAVAAVTSKIGLVATLSTTYNNPRVVAERFSSLDHLSGGRSAWNIVTTSNDEAVHNFGLHFRLEKNSRYQKAQEFVDLTVALWDSWDEGAVISNAASGQFIDPSRIHKLDHNGEFFQLAGASGLPRPPQGRPVLVQAGASEPGQAFAASVGELIFTAEANMESAQRFRSKLHELVRSLHRKPEHALVMPGLSTLIGGTEEEAKRKEKELNELILPVVGRFMLSDLLKAPLDHLSMDDLLPVADLRKQGVQNYSRAVNLLERAERESLTVGQAAIIVARARSHGAFVGTPEQLADHIQTWVEAGACDGFNIMPPYFPEQLEWFVDEVVPLLQKRGAFRTEYEGATLRNHLHLPFPKSSRRPVA